jgi:phytoene dehydrogenase-like protein
MPDAIVIGSGPNGLAAAITLAQAGLAVEVREAAETVGGGLRSAGLTLPGFVHDVCSAIHPLAVGSPFFRTLDLDVDWVHPDAAVAHPFDDGTAVTLELGLSDTAVQLGADADAYRRLLGPLVRAWDDVQRVALARLLPPSPADAARLVGGLGVPGAVAALRAGVSTARGLAVRTFATERARAFLAGNAAHSMLPLETRPSAAFGIALLGLGHVHGWPFPRGGAQALADALAERLRSLGGEIRLGAPVDELPAARMVLADVSPQELLRIADLPRRYAAQLRRYRYGPGAFKLDWALDGPIPWTAAACSRAATVHLGGTLPELVASERAPWEGRPPERPFVLLAQHSVFDETRAPAGKHTAWAYCHVPNGWDGDATEAVEAQIERFAPGFRELILARSALGPAALQSRNRNLVGGDINGGAATLGQTVFRPVRSVVPYRTGRPGVYLCSASTPPGGGVHGMCGHLAGRQALRDLGVE